MREETDVINIIDDTTPFSVKEAYRLLRANIQFLSPHDGCKVICVTSSVAHEGKSSVSYNLSSVIADGSSKVLLLDADLRASHLQLSLGSKGKEGLSDILAGLASSEDYMSLIKKDENHPNLDILVAGKVPPNPSELLSSERMVTLLDELKKEYDYIIIDGTPLCLVSDMLVLSPYIDGYVIVVRAEMTNKKILNKSVSMIKKINGKVLGFVLSRKKQKKSERYYYGEYGSSKYL